MRPDTPSMRHHHHIFRGRNLALRCLSLFLKHLVTIVIDEVGKFTGSEYEIVVHDKLVAKVEQTYRVMFFALVVIQKELLHGLAGRVTVPLLTQGGLTVPIRTTALGRIARSRHNVTVALRLAREVHPVEDLRVRFKRR